MGSAEDKLRKYLETTTQTWNDIVGAVKKAYAGTYNFEDKRKPKSVEELIEQKKNKKPFYKDKNKKNWEG